MLNNKTTLKLFLLNFCIFFICGTVTAQNKNLRFLDSAQFYVSENPKKAQIFLDSIQKPILKNLEGSLAKYYNIKGLINDRLHESAKLYQNFLLALKYAKIEKNYDIAGMSSFTLFYNTYIIKKDSSAFKYLDDAKHYFTLSNNISGLADVMQAEPYLELVNGNYIKSNELILKDLEYYRNITYDGYYYMYALFMLSLNYAHLEELPEAHKYFELLKNVENDDTVSKSILKTYIATVDICIAEFYHESNAADSTLFYLKRTGKSINYLDKTSLKQYYNLYINYYDSLNDLDKKNDYLDSLNVLQNKELKKTVEASVELNNTLIESDKILQSETKKKKLNRTLVGVLIVLLLAIVIYVSRRYSKIKDKINGFLKQKDEYSFLQTNHDKLKVKVRGLEDYIKDVKKEIKKISSINDVSVQREMIKELYKDLNLNSSTILDKSKSHLELVNELNIEFFKKINEEHPDLDDSEVIICYYLLIGFNNNEIAVFLNKTLRSIENKRFRAGKKLNIKEKNLSLINFLQAFSPNKDYSN